MLGVGTGVVLILETGLLEDTIVTTYLWCKHLYSC